MFGRLTSWRSAPRRLGPDDAWYPWAGALLVGGPTWYALFDSHYPFSTPEGILIPLVAGGLGGLIGSAARRFRGPAATLVFALLLFAFADLQFDLEASVRWPLRLAVAALVAVMIQAHRARIVTLALGAFYLTSLVRFGPPAEPVQSASLSPELAPPPLLHVILDEEWGPGGLRAAGDTATADVLTDFYRERGFTVYAGAYSRYLHTAPSIAAMFALGAPPVTEERHGLYRLVQNRYFARLESRGYHLRVFQTSHLDLCGESSSRRCRTEYANSLGNVGYLDTPWPTRAFLAGRYLVAWRTDWHRALRPRSRAGWTSSHAGRALEVVREVREDIAAHGGPGVAHVVHLLLPHIPFEVDSTCTAYADVMVRDSLNRRSRRAEALVAYANQVRCVHRAIAGLIATFDSLTGKGPSTIIVQGDHGSRLFGTRDTRDLAGLDPAGLNAAFSTLFAIRTGRQRDTVMPEAVPIQDLFGRLVGGDFTNAVVAGPWQAFVALNERALGADTIRFLTEREMPWAKPATGTAVAAVPRD